MYRDPSEFRERFKAYKDGKSVREIYGLPGYAGGKSSSAVDDTADFLRLYEGFKEKTYLDGKGIPTIGYGFTDAKFVNKGKITRAEAETELKRQIAVRQAELRRKLGPLVWDSLSNDSKKALTSYHFNYPAGFKDNTKFMLYWRAGKYSDAIKEVDAGWNDPDNPGLRTRRIAELKLLRSDPALFSRLIPEKPSDITILRPDVLRVATTMPQEKTIPIADPRNATIAEAQRAMWAHAAFENMPKVSDMPIWESPSLPALTPVEYDVTPFKYNNGKLPGYSNGKIRIKPANRGKFNATKKRTGKTTEELTHSKNPLTRKRAIFALNARKWHHADGKLPSYEDGHPRITTGGAGVTSVYLPAPNSPEVQPTVDLLERIANFLPYVGTIQDWEQVVNGNIGKVPSAVMGTVADVFLPGLRSSYKAAKAYEAASKAAPKLVDKIKYYKASQKAYKKTAANVGYLVAGTYEDILDDLGYQFPLFINK